MMTMTTMMTINEPDYILSNYTIYKILINKAVNCTLNLVKGNINNILKYAVVCH